MPLFSLFLALFFVRVWFTDMRNAWRIRGAFLKSNVFKFTLKAALLIVAMVYAVNSFLPVLGDGGLRYAFSLILSAAISYVWYLYLRAIDVFEPERKRYLFITFFLSCVTIWAVFPITGLLKFIGFDLGGGPFSDFIYCVVAIGGVEEFVKLLPLLFMLAFTKQINEPIDYVVYAGMSALGFAFVENTMYLVESQLAAVGARLLYASVAHMFFASCIAYPLAIYRVKTGKSFNLLVLFGGFVLAALAHGFYDFWLITESLRLPWVTTIFFLGSLHLFTVMKNNLINQSNYYQDHLLLNRNALKYNLLWYLLLVIYLGYAFYAMLHGAAAANGLLLQSALVYVSVVVYISLTFSNLTFIKGYRKKLKFPLRFFWPKVDAYPDFSGLRMRFEAVQRSIFNKKQFEKISFSGTLSRVVLADDANWYLVADEAGKSYLVRLHASQNTLHATNATKVTMVSLNVPFSGSIFYQASQVGKKFTGAAWLI